MKEKYVSLRIFTNNIYFNQSIYIIIYQYFTKVTINTQCKKNIIPDPRGM